MLAAISDIWRQTNLKIACDLSSSSLCFRLKKESENMPDLPYVGLDEIKNDPKGFGKALFAEFLGTALLVSKSNNTISKIENHTLDITINCVATKIRTQIVHLIALKGVCWLRKLHG